MSALSIVIPTFKREEILVDTIRSLLPQLRSGDELFVIDQTPTHLPQTAEALTTWHQVGAIRWYRKRTPNQCEAMNVGALLAGQPLMVFLDDDIIPCAGLLDAHRQALDDDPGLAATCGQVLQPWHQGPISSVRDYELSFDPAYDRPCEVLALIGANFAVRRDALLSVGGLDENFRGSTYRNETELAFRLFARSRRLIRFVPEASVRHLHSAGGVRGYGGKDGWGSIGASAGDYYFALRSLPAARAFAHMARRLVRAPVNRNTLRRPWLIPWLALRETVALGWAVLRARFCTPNLIKQLTDYPDVETGAE